MSAARMVELRRGSLPSSAFGPIRDGLCLDARVHFVAGHDFLPDVHLQQALDVFEKLGVRGVRISPSAAGTRDVDF